MRHAQIHIGRSLLTLALVAGLTAGFVSQPAAAQSPIEQAVLDARPVSYQVVAQSFSGSMKDTGDFLKTFMTEFSAQGLEGQLSGPDVRPLQILRGNPDLSPVIPMEIGFPVAGSAGPSSPLSDVTLAFPRAVVYTHQGAYHELSNVHARIRDAVARLAPGHRTAWPVVLRLLNDPNLVAPDQILTEIIVPLER